MNFGVFWALKYATTSTGMDWILKSQIGIIIHLDQMGLFPAHHPGLFIKGQGHALQINGKIHEF